MTTRIKICGLTTLEAVQAAAEAGADYVGFVFHEKSPRNISFAEAKKLSSFAKSPTVAVVVNPTDELLKNIVDALNPTYIQLHGEESPSRAEEIKKTFSKPIIKAIAVHYADDIAKAEAYHVADYFMFDAKSPGSGKTFDWSLLAGQKLSKPWFLSGGLNAANVAEAVRITNAPMVDVSSGVESAPGMKDLGLIKEFIARVKSL